MRTVWLFLIFSLMMTNSHAQYIITYQAGTLSTSPQEVEAAAVSSDSIDIYLPKSHAGVSVQRNCELIAVLKPGERVFRDRDLKPDTIYTYEITGISGSPVTIAEKTFPAFQPMATYDVIVVGATASGTAAAVAAARLGASVALIEESTRIGGMASNGVSVSDIRDPSHSNGFFEEFRANVEAYYGEGSGLRYEPRVANAIMKAMVYAEPGISLFRRARAVGSIIEGPRVAGVRVEDLNTGQTGELYARVIIDATVEADIAADAGAKFRIPREARSLAEPHAGQIYFDNSTDEIQPGSSGAADNRIQSYAYLLTVKEYLGEDRTIPAPSNYNPNDYRYSPAWLDSWAYAYGKLPNGKFELNEHPWGSDLPGVNYDYPYVAANERAQIAELYRWQALGYLHYVQTELGMKSLGLAEDEYPETCGFPPTLYVREARRMIGRSMMNESDVFSGGIGKAWESVAIGDYPMDSHATRTVQSPNVKDRGEGEFWLVRYTPWYRIPLGVIIPENVPGLIVSTAVSATHVAYGTLRMEAVRMSLGQAAGTLAGLSIRFGVYPTEIPVAMVQDRLLEQKAFITWFSDVDKSTRHFRAIQFLSARGFFPGETFRPEEFLSREESSWLMNRLLAVETEGSMAPVQPPPTAGGAPITRAEFAQMLVATKSQIDCDWQPKSHPVSHYADIQPGTPVSQAAEELFRHRIDTVTWAGPSSIVDNRLYFYPDAPLMRADAAQAIWLADRVSALGFQPKSPPPYDGGAGKGYIRVFPM